MTLLSMYNIQRPAATTSTRRMTPKIARVCVHVARTASTVAGSAVLLMLSGDNGCSAMREIPGSRESSQVTNDGSTVLAAFSPTRSFGQDRQACAHSALVAQHERGHIVVLGRPQCKAAHRGQ